MAPVKYRILALLAVLIVCAAAAHAQQPLGLQIANGRVTLHAQNVPVRTILAEWARLGGAKIVNGDRVAGAPVTLDLENVPERQALDIILRGVSGYMLAARDAAASGASIYDRIMILPTSVAPRNPPPSAPVVSRGPAPIISRPIAAQPDDQDADDDPPQDVAPGDEDGAPIPRPLVLPRPIPTAIGGVAPISLPPATVVPNDTPQQTPPAVITTPGNPFGMPPGSSGRPGGMTPTPAQQTAPPPPNAGNPN